jgi:hypothetical protein
MAQGGSISFKQDIITVCLTARSPALFIRQEAQGVYTWATKQFMTLH